MRALFAPGTNSVSKSRNTALLPHTLEAYLADSATFASVVGSDQFAGEKKEVNHIIWFFYYLMCNLRRFERSQTN